MSCWIFLTCLPFLDWGKYIRPVVYDFSSQMSCATKPLQRVSLSDCISKIIGKKVALVGHIHLMLWILSFKLWGYTIEALCSSKQLKIMENFKHAMVWGRSVMLIMRVLILSLFFFFFFLNFVSFLVANCVLSWS